MVFWLIIIMIVAALIGPVVYLMPTKREKRLSEVRLLARKLGLRVSVEGIPDLNIKREELVSPSGIARSPTVECAVYRLRFDNLDDQAFSWAIYKSNNALLGFVQAPLKGWIWEGLEENGLQITENYWERLEKAMDELPEQCLALEVTQEFVAWKGKEIFAQEPSEVFVERMKITLSGIAKIQ